MVRLISRTKEFREVSAYIILNTRKEHIASVHTHSSDTGVFSVEVIHLDDETPDQSSKAIGHGYNKLGAALTGLAIGGVKLERGDLAQLEDYGYTIIQAL